MPEYDSHQLKLSANLSDLVHLKSEVIILNNKLIIPNLVQRLN